jgi:transcriptional regulator with XRE-family HTH domain
MEKVVHMSLGSRLRDEREKRRWSQIEVAKKIGITNAVLSNYERGSRDPDTDTLKKLADLYDVSADYLLGRTNEQNNYIEEKGEMYFFDKDNVTPEEIEEAKRYIEVRRQMLKDKKNK